MRILVTGGAGFIGSHTCVKLLEAGKKVVVLDNLSNSRLSNLQKVSKITTINLDLNEDNKSYFSFIKGDIRDKNLLERLFFHFNIKAVIHFAGLKSVPDSIKKPADYFDNNVNGSITLLEIMKKFDCKTLIFSSSASVYGEVSSFPINENFPLNPMHPYAQSKVKVENLLRELLKYDKNWHIAILRYFNPIGAHSSGLIGDNPEELPTNLVPIILQVAMGKLKELIIFGSDYDTHDGTGVRDYIHVEDVANSHIKALSIIRDKAQLLTLNLGTGVGHSVIDLVKMFEKVTNKKIPFRIHERRAGDPAKCYADPALAFIKMDWKSEKNLEQMCFDSWNFQNNQKY
jgi:UDP-glucose 4-epimerase